MNGLLKKIIVHACTAVTVLTVATNVFAAEMNWTYDDENAAISIKGYGMINDGSPILKYLDTAKKINILKGVTKIENNVFTNSGGIEEVVLPENFISIGKNSFAYNANLKSINFPESLESIGDEAFIGCPNLENVTIGKNVTYIGTNAFADCAKITSFNVSEENPKYKTVDGVLFTKDESELIMYPSGREDTSYSVPSGTTKISPKAFSYNTKLKEITIPDTVSDFGDYTFYFCEELKTVNLGKGVKSIGNYAFYGTRLKSIFVPYGCETLGDSVFKNCTELTTVDIPGTIKSIGTDAFYGTDDSFKIRGFGDVVSGYAANGNVPYENTVRVIVNGKELNPDRPAFVENGCTMVPMRSIFEALGADVDWNGETQTAYAVKDGIECRFTIGDKYLYKNGIATELSAPAVLRDSRTLVHVRAIAEAFEKDVTWDGQTGLVNIVDK